jgi:hypothetical protein
MSNILTNNIASRSGDTINVNGNLSIGGTLTYEDVSNVDSIGVVTARSRLDVGVGGTVLTTTTSGNIGIGTTNPSSLLQIKNGTNSGFSGAQLKIGDNTDTGIQINQAGDNTGGGRLVFGKARGTLDAPTTLLTDDQLFTTRGFGYVGSTGGWVHGGYYGLFADGAVSDASQGLGARFSVHLRSNGGTVDERLRIDSTGNIGIGTTNPESALHVQGGVFANGSYSESVAGDATLDKTITFNTRGAFMMLISNALSTTTTDFTRNVYSFGLFVPRSNGATWTAIQEDLTSTHVGNFTISDAGTIGALRVQKSAGSDGRQCSFRIDVLSSTGVEITVTDT